ncbi:hypothetical protein ABDK56_00265 [Sphingomonas sp. ASV193]|uniref:DUF3617 domain-containing protein n=1 Tax=Sphingomonas sp. ASV193 TaxID=3144405 RepID=UPI0032E8CB90
MKSLFLIAAAALLTAGSSPGALAGVDGGAWEVGKSADGHDATKVCIADPMQLAQWEHRGGRCSRVVLSDSGNKVVVQFTCADGAFGRSDIEVLTPRTLRIATQGISGGYPFQYTLHARRDGACAPH